MQKIAAKVIVKQSFIVLPLFQMVPYSDLEMERRQFMMAILGSASQEHKTV